MKIFLIAGKSGSGKGEVARIINEYYIYKLQSCVITEYSKYLKMFATELTDWDGMSKNKPRDFLQQIGDVVRGYDKYYLIKRMIEDIKIYDLNKIENVVIADVRMPEEIEEMKENYDNVYSIIVLNQFSPSALTIKQQSHNTETALEDYEDFDGTIVNDGTLEDLKEKVFKYLEGLEK